MPVATSATSLISNALRLILKRISNRFAKTCGIAHTSLCLLNVSSSPTPRNAKCLPPISATASFITFISTIRMRCLNALSLKTVTEWFVSLVPIIAEYLSSRLDLSIHEGKTMVCDIEKGVEYLGAFLLPYRTYLSRATLERIDRKLFALEAEGRSDHVGNALNSYCGVLSHWDNYDVRQTMLLHRHCFTRYGSFDLSLRHFYD